MMTPLPNEILIRHSLLEWIRIIDLMRADRYALLSPDAEFSRLEDLLEIRTLMPETDRNHIMYNTLFHDRFVWSRATIYGDYPAGGPRVTPAYPHEGSTWDGKYPGLHGAKTFPLCGYQNSELDRLMTYHKPWSRLLRKIYEVCSLYNGLVYPARGYSTVYARVCEEHDGTTPTGKWEEMTFRKSDLFGNWQHVWSMADDWYIVETRVSFLKIEDFKLPFDFPCRLTIAGRAEDVYQFDGMGFVEYPGCQNVFFESGIIQGSYTSPLIGVDKVFASADMEDFKNNNQTGYAGWRVDDCCLILYPAEGTFPDYF